MKSILYQQGRAALADVPEPTIGPDEALIAVEACGLCGSDLLKLVDPHITGTILGHEVSGRIAKLGARVSQFKAGDRVVAAHHASCLKCHYCLRGSPSSCAQFRATNLNPGGFSERLLVGPKHLQQTVLKLPERLDFLTATFTEPLACCLRNVKRIGVRPGDAVGVVGLGSIGLLTGQLVRHFGGMPIGFDLDASRQALARELGFTVPESADRAAILKLSGGRGLDALIFTAGTPELASERLSWLRGGGTLSIFAEFSRKDGRALAALDLNEIYHRELTILSSYSSAPEDLREALAILAAEQVDVSPFTHDVFPLEDFDRAVSQTKSRAILKAIISPALVVSAR